MEVSDSEGHFIFAREKVLEKWKTVYIYLLNSESAENFDDEHYETVLRRRNSATNIGQINVHCLNQDFTYQ